VSVEGELRYREFVPKKQKKHKTGDHKIRVAKIHLWRIAKLDRAEKRTCARARSGNRGPFSPF